MAVFAVIVLHLFPRLVLGGAERVVLDLVRGLPAEGVECRLCVFSEDGIFPDRDLVPRDRLTLEYRAPIGHLRATAAAVRTLRRLISQVKPDILHTHLWPADVVGAAAVAKSGVRHVSHQQGTGEGLRSKTLSGACRRFVSRRLMRWSGAQFIAVSESVRSYVAEVYGVAEEAVPVIYNGFAPALFPGRSGSLQDPLRTVTIGFAGRFAEEKGVETLIVAYSSLMKTGVNAQLHLAGRGGEEPRYRELVALHQLEDRVVFHGPVSGMASFYEGLDVFVLPSLSAEGFSLGLIEAMAMGCVPVASNVPGVDEAIRDGVDGFIVKPGDVAGLSAKLATLCADADLRRRMGESAQKRAHEEFTAERMVKGVARVYREVVGGRAAE